MSDEEESKKDDATPASNDEPKVAPKDEAKPVPKDEAPPEESPPSSAASAVVDPRADWSDARPELIPRPSFWPAGLAFGITLLFWGFITSPVLIVFGLAVVVVSLVGWIGEMRDEQRRSS